MHRSKKSKLLILAALSLMFGTAACLIFAPNSKAPVVQLTITGWQTNQNKTWALLQLTNAGSRPIVYVAYERDQPMCHTSIKMDGLHTSVFLSMGGVRDWKLRPGQSVSFNAQLPDDPSEIRLNYTADTPLYEFYRSFPDWITHWFPQPDPPAVLTVVATDRSLWKFRVLHND